jgi:hypothetical protein
MTFNFSVTDGRIEGPMSVSNAYRLEGPLGAQDFFMSEAAELLSVELLVEMPDDSAAAEAASPAASRVS